MIHVSIKRPVRLDGPFYVDGKNESRGFICMEKLITQTIAACNQDGGPGEKPESHSRYSTEGDDKGKIADT